MRMVRSGILLVVYPLTFGRARIGMSRPGIHQWLQFNDEW